MALIHRECDECGEPFLRSTQVSKGHICPICKLPKAVFIIYQLPNGKFAATTRVGGGVGLPGGKVEQGEALAAAALREAREEGWAVDSVLPMACRRGIKSHHSIHWFTTFKMTKLDEYKEKGRIAPVTATFDELLAAPVMTEAGREALQYYMSLFGVITPREEEETNDRLNYLIGILLILAGIAIFINYGK